MKKLTKFLIITVIIVGIFYLIYSNPKFSNKVLSPIPQPKPSEYEYFVPVSKFTNTKSFYTLDEIKSSKLITTYENFDLLKDKFNVETVLPENLLTILNEDYIALLRPAQVLPKYKTLYVDDYYFWDKDVDLANYPFKFKVENSKYESKEKTYFFAGGEIIPTRAVDRLGLNIHDNYTYLFDFFKDDIKNADLAIALLENSLNGNPTPCKGCMLFEGDDQVAHGLKEVGFDFLSLAGNHAGDAGQKAMGNTMDLLDKENINYTGSTKGSYENSFKPITKVIGGKNIGMISADDIAFYYWYSGNEDKFYTTNFSTYDSSIGLTIDKSQVEKIKSIKQENQIDYLIVYMSWGVEYTNYPTKHQTELAHMIIDNGADLIIASHPHWVQNVEFYNNVPIIYSMGNFIFDQTHTLPTRQAFVTKLHYWGNELKSIELIPFQTCGYHQTSNDIADKYLKNEITLDDVYNTEEKDGCVWWQPKKLKQDNPSFKQILERVFEYTKIE